MAGVNSSLMATVANLGHVYPAPLRYHIDVVMNPDTFFDTLLSFHSSMGNRFTNPVIGGEKLDMFHLYFLVTQRGGIEKAVVDEKWREVIAGLNIPRNITNRSFVVKKHYIKLLFHYEQVYFFRRQGPIISPSAILVPRSLRNRFVNDLNLNINEAADSQASESSASAPHNLALGQNRTEAVPPHHHNEEGNNVAGSGLFPVATASIQNGNGAASTGDAPSNQPTFRVDINEAQSAPASVAANGDAAPGIAATSPSFTENTSIGARSPQTNRDAHEMGGNMRAGERSEHNNLLTVPNGSLSAANFPAFLFSTPVGSVAHPSPCRSAYNIFFEEKYSAIRNLPPRSTREFVKLIEESWDKLTEDERGVYNEQEKMDRERYRRELQEHRERMRIMQSRDPARANTVERGNTG